MFSQTSFHPVEDSVPKVNDAIAVGENLDFQRRWWRFERIVWTIFLLILICDLLGLFGRGWLANATRKTPDGALILQYERIERTSTPSIMTLHFGSSAIVNGHVQFFVSDSMVKGLGAQRIAPQPALSTIGDGGITYTFAASQSPATVQIQLEPSFPGMHHFRVQCIGGKPIEARVFVVP
jgi:hypothetical protein